ncbi:hypothetical protein [Pedobacter aquatilis]|uniref:hypothetical protein n=1 Tax=Pedobacter aquatilis TaxID=351343 RepID=UPI0029305063|nr:hypothetical protein [Pedobacter aquatilis]
MVYLIDDKRERQQKLGWTQEKLAGFKDVLTPIYDNAELELHKGELFNEGNAILFHESFFDNPLNKKNDEADEIGQRLAEFSEKRSFPIVRFSGSMGSRRIRDLLATMPFATLYQHLLIFLEFYRATHEVSFKKLVFGSNDQAEEILQHKAEIYRSLFDKQDTDSFKLNAKINQSLKQLELITKSQLVVTGITNACFKRQLEEL